MSNFIPFTVINFASIYFKLLQLSTSKLFILRVSSPVDTCDMKRFYFFFFMKEIA
jgi:hypothetical protein